MKLIYDRYRVNCIILIGYAALAFCIAVSQVRSFVVVQLPEKAAPYSTAAGVIAALVLLLLFAGTAVRNDYAGRKESIQDISVPYIIRKLLMYVLIWGSLLVRLGTIWVDQHYYGEKAGKIDLLFFQLAAQVGTFAILYFAMKRAVGWLPAILSCVLAAFQPTMVVSNVYQAQPTFWFLGFAVCYALQVFFTEQLPETIGWKVYSAAAVAGIAVGLCASMHPIYLGLMIWTLLTIFCLKAEELGGSKLLPALAYGLFVMLGLLIGLLIFAGMDQITLQEEALRWYSFCGVLFRAEFTVMFSDWLGIAAALAALAMIPGFFTKFGNCFAPLMGVYLWSMLFLFSGARVLTSQILFFLCCACAVYGLIALMSVRKNDGMTLSLPVKRQMREPERSVLPIKASEERLTETPAINRIKPEGPEPIKKETVRSEPAIPEPIRLESVKKERPIVEDMKPAKNVSMPDLKAEELPVLPGAPLFNPLPQPKKKERKQMEYAIEPAEHLMHFDIEPGLDFLDYDLKDDDNG